MLSPWRSPRAPLFGAGSRNRFDWAARPLLARDLGRRLALMSFTASVRSAYAAASVGSASHTSTWSKTSGPFPRGDQKQRRDVAPDHPHATGTLAATTEVVEEDVFHERARPEHSGDRRDRIPSGEVRGSHGVRRALSAHGAR